MARLIDRCVCRREGHQPAMTITSTTGLTITSYITTCRRCGKIYATTPAPSPQPPT
jgi:hypothetical protein